MSNNRAALAEPVVLPIAGEPPVIVPAPLNWSTPSLMNTEASLPDPNVSDPVTSTRLLFWMIMSGSLPLKLLFKLPAYVIVRRVESVPAIVSNRVTELLLSM